MPLITTTSRAFRALLAVLALILVALVAAACTGGEEEPEATGTLEEPADAPSSEEESEEAEEEPSPSPSPSEAVLPEEWEQDSDGNAIPDFIEESIGYDPLTDDCVLRTCPGAESLDPAATAGGIDQNVMLLLDASGSMAGPDGSGAVKIDAARSALERYAYGVPPNFRLGLEVFGHRGSNTESGKAESCAGIDIASPLGSLTADGAAAALNQFQPTGYTPIAAALQRAAEAFTGTEGAGNRVILVTDGIETCDGDPVAAAAALKQAGIAVTVDVVGFDIEGDADRAALQAIADATGGTYSNADDAADLDAYFDDQLAQAAAILDTYGCVGAAFNAVYACVNDVRSAAQQEMNRLAREEDDRQVAVLISGYVSEELLPAFEDRLRDDSALRDRVERDLLDQFDAVKLRYQERYGRPVAFAPLCSDRLA